jgi:hypothetical protein
MWTGIKSKIVFGASLFLTVSFMGLSAVAKDSDAPDFMPVPVLSNKVKRQTADLIEGRIISKELAKAGLAKEIPGPRLSSHEEQRIRQMVSVLVKGGVGNEVTDKDLKALEKTLSKLGPEFQVMNKKGTHTERKKAGFGFLLGLVRDLYASLKDSTGSGEKAASELRSILTSESLKESPWGLSSAKSNQETKLDYLLQKLANAKVAEIVQKESVQKVIVSQAEVKNMGTAPVKEKSKISDYLLKPFRSLFGSSGETQTAKSEAGSAR